MPAPESVVFQPTTQTTTDSGAGWFAWFAETQQALVQAQ